jgi:hypothetical protein
LEQKKNPAEAGFSNMTNRYVNLFARRIEVRQLDHIGGVHPPQRAIAIAYGDNLIVRADNKFRWLDDLAAVFPPRSQLVGDLAGDAVTDGEIHLVGDFLRFVDRINAGGDNLGARRIEFVF